MGWGLSGSAEALESLTNLRDLKLRDHHGLCKLGEWIARLEKLEKLDVSCCSSLASLPNEIVSLKNLIELDASHCGLRSLPEELDALSKLKRLDLGGNIELFSSEAASRRDSPKALSGMTSLEFLNLEGCGLDFVPSFVSSLVNLEVLLLDDNTLSIGALGKTAETQLRRN